MTIYELKKQFTIIINEHEFVPQVTYNETYYNLEYLNDNFMLGFAVAKGSHVGVIKNEITNSILDELQSKGVLL